MEMYNPRLYTGPVGPAGLKGSISSLWHLGIGSLCFSKRVGFGKRLEASGRSFVVAHANAAWSLSMSIVDLYTGFDCSVV